ncbi:MAG: sigma-70 family RNA polymerase sigma factor [Planctomycetaceae bacterium]|nr:sigma-70 family RNA polymerase sigma factor [Planctomycetaceae bacterium]
MDNRSNYEPFPTTMWSLVKPPEEGDEEQHRATMERLAAGYWRPVYCFIRSRGYSASRAEDLTQEFFLQLLDRDWIRRADRQRGRFRTFLLTILVRFLSDQGPNRAPRQRQFDTRMVPISSLIRDGDRHFEPSDSQTPEHVFMRQWAKAVVATTCRRLETWCRERGKSQWHDVFQLLRFPDPGRPRPTQEAIAEQLGISRDQVRYAAAETSSQFAELLRQEIAGQVESGLDIEQELCDLQTVLAE